MAPKAVFVEWALQDGLMDESEVAQREFFRQKLEADRRVAELPADSAHGCPDDLVVIERQGEWRTRGIDRSDGTANLARPGHMDASDRQAIRALVSDCVIKGRRVDEGVVRDRDHSSSRVAARPAERVQLLREDGMQVRFLPENATRRVVEGLVHAHEPARQTPRALRRMIHSPAKEDVEVSTSYRQQDDVDRHGRPLVP